MISLTPFAWQSSNSDAFIRRDASSMSGCPAPTPAQNSFMPAPVPVDSIMGDFMPGLLLTNCSATAVAKGKTVRSEEHTSELQSLMRISYAVFCLKTNPTNHLTLLHNRH